MNKVYTLVTVSKYDEVNVRLVTVDIEEVRSAFNNIVEDQLKDRKYDPNEDGTYPDELQQEIDKLNEFGLYEGGGYFKTVRIQMNVLKG